MSEVNPSSVEFRGSADVQHENDPATILLAEDEPGLRQMLADILKAAGYHLMIAEDGHQALQLANGHSGRIDLLVSDIQMPGVTGPGVAEELKRSRPELKIMLMSGCVSPSVVFESEWRFLQKPFEPNQLLEEVRVALR